MHDPHAARTGERDRETRLGHGVHRRGDQRDVQRDRGRQPSDGRDVVREDVRLGGDEEHVVEREPFLAELPLERDEALDLLLAELGLHHDDVSSVRRRRSGEVDSELAELRLEHRATRDVALRLVNRGAPRPRTASRSQGRREGRAPRRTTARARLRQRRSDRSLSANSSTLVQPLVRQRRAAPRERARRPRARRAGRSSTASPDIVRSRAPGAQRRHLGIVRGTAVQRDSPRG